MAIVKHMSSKNSHYSDGVSYLTQQYDEKINKPILDQDGLLQERDEYLISYIRSDGSYGDVHDWEKDCRMTDIKYNQNRSEGSIKTHHYVVAFEDDDNVSLEDCQKFGEELAVEMFPGTGHLVSAHPGHVHIIVHSVRDAEIEKQDWMKKRCEYAAGAKHNCSGTFLRALKERVMEMSKERGLHQIDLLKPAKTRKTDKEYHAEKSAARSGKITQKEFVRRAIDAVKDVATSPKHFCELLQEQGVEVGRRSKSVRYKTADGGKWMRDNSLGTDYEFSTIATRIKERQKTLQKPQNLSLDDKIDRYMEMVEKDKTAPNRPTREHERSL